MKNSEWRSRAACLGMPTDMFFLKRGDSSKEAKEICSSCPVKTECLDEAVHINPIYDTYGIYGGKSSRERNKIRKELGLVFTPISHTY
jgi:WhiB family redox-sensing transcriptional regulator